jgi:hypothetical protein
MQQYSSACPLNFPACSYTADNSRHYVECACNTRQHFTGLLHEHYEGASQIRGGFIYLMAHFTVDEKIQTIKFKISIKIFANRCI